ncbi:MAG TPA: cation-transporting P-type ATPase, partial [Alicycliphilus sp.]|nr:cation-transporting P-type ATPase [Alicycliphilus sp.]
MRSMLFRDIFAGFVRTRRILRHYRRLALLETLTRTGVSREPPESLTQALNAAAHSDGAALLTQLGSSAAGLTKTQADAVRERVGPNEVEHEKPLPWWLHLWHSFRNPFNLLLTLLAGISFLTHDTKGALLISTMVVLSTLLRFWQERKSNQAADALKAMVSNTATVLRPAQAAGAEARRMEVAIKLLVPGDLVWLSAGDMIPAD